MGALFLALSMGGLLATGLHVSEDKINKIKFLFENADANQDGKLTHSEMTSLVKMTNPWVGEHAKRDASFEVNPWSDHVEFAKSIGADPNGITMANLISAYTQAYGDLDTDYLLVKQFLSKTGYWSEKKKPSRVLSSIRQAVKSAKANAVRINPHAATKGVQTVSERLRLRSVREKNEI